MVNFYFLLALTFLLSANKCAYNGKVRVADSPVDTLADETVPVEQVTAAEINFEEEIKPILQSRCSPCHFTGGKMYERLPFDKGETIVNHSAGILRRIKDEVEAKKIRDFIESTSSD